MNTAGIRILALIAATFLVLLVIAQALAEAPANELFERTWARTDQPVLDGSVARTWMWGPEAFTGGMSEPYAEAPGGERTVQYFDKSRMEDNAWRTTEPPWDVTNGLLVVELITGRLQLGDDQFEQRTPAEVNVAGDPDGASGPTYATFAAVLNAPPLPVGSTITQRINRAGAVSDDPSLAEQGVTVAFTDEVTEHSIAAPFWSFMNSAGLVLVAGQVVEEALFENPYFATGRPVTEAYWADVQVGGTLRLVLTQCFERRCLTYTPGNPEGFVVEAGNVGQHYYRWRYEQPAAPTPTPDPDVTPTPTPDPDVTPTPTLTPPPGATPTPEPATEYRFRDELSDWPAAFDFPNAIAVAPDGRVYVVDSHNSQILVYRESGTHLYGWGTRGSAITQFTFPNAVAIDGVGRVYVADRHRIQRFGPQGTYLDSWGEFGSGNGQFTNPNGIAIGEDGKIYVIEGGGSTPRVQYFDADGTYLGKWGSHGSGDGQFMGPNDIAIARYRVQLPVPPSGIPVTFGEEVLFVADTFNHRVQAFLTDGTYLGSWGSRGDGPGEFQFPYGIAGDSQGRIYVADTNNYRIQKFRVNIDYNVFTQQFSVSASHLTEWGSRGDGPGEFRRPWGIDVTADSRVYVTDTNRSPGGNPNNRVQIFDLSGAHLDTWDQGRLRLAAPRDVAIADDDSEIFIADTVRHRILVVDVDGNYLRRWGTLQGRPGSGDEEFNLPSGIALDGDVLYVADTRNNRIVKYTREGEFLLAWTGGLDAPTDVAVDRNGDVYVVDSGNDRIRKFSSDGAYLGEWGNTGDQPGLFRDPWGIAVDHRHGHVLVTDTGNYRVQIFDHGGTFLAEFGSEGMTEGEFQAPTGIAVDEYGFIYVVDRARSTFPKIQIFTPDGVYLAGFGTSGPDQPGRFRSPYGIAVDGGGNVYVADAGNNRIQVFEPAE